MIVQLCQRNGDNLLLLLLFVEDSCRERTEGKRYIYVIRMDLNVEKQAREQLRAHKTFKGEGEGESEMVLMTC